MYGSSHTKVTLLADVSGVPINRGRVLGHPTGSEEEVSSCEGCISQLSNAVISGGNSKDVQRRQSNCFYSPSQHTYTHCLLSPLSVQAVISSHYTLPSPSPLTFSSSHTAILSDSILSVYTRLPHFTHFTSQAAPTSPSLPPPNPLTLSRSEVKHHFLICTG